MVPRAQQCHNVGGGGGGNLNVTNKTNKQFSFIDRFSKIKILISLKGTSLPVKK